MVSPLCLLAQNLSVRGWVGRAPLAQPPASSALGAHFRPTFRTSGRASHSAPARAHAAPARLWSTRAATRRATTAAFRPPPSRAPPPVGRRSGVLLEVGDLEWDRAGGHGVRSGRVWRARGAPSARVRMGGRVRSALPSLDRMSAVVVIRWSETCEQVLLWGVDAGKLFDHIWFRVRPRLDRTRLCSANSGSDSASRCRPNSSRRRPDVAWTPPKRNDNTLKRSFSKTAYSK